MNVLKILKFLEKEKDIPLPLIAKLIYAPEDIKEEDLIVKSELEINHPKIKKLPDNLTVEKELMIGSNSSLTRLPEGLIVENYLEIVGTKISSIPEDLIVGSTLKLVGMKHLKRIPKGFIFPPTVILVDIPFINELKGDWSRVKSLTIRIMNIQRFPPNLKKLKKLEFIHATVKEIPEGLEVDELSFLYCLDNLENIPKNLTVKGTLKIALPSQDPREPKEVIKDLRAKLEAEGGNIQRIGVSAGIARFKIG